MSDSEAIRATVQQYADRHTHGTIAELIELFAPDAVVRDPVDEPAYQGVDAIAAFFAQARAMGDSLTISITGPICVAVSEAAFPLRAVTRVGDVDVSIDIIDVMTFDDDARITSMHAYWNLADAVTTPAEPTN